ncbi:cytochrome P450 4c3-like, partial [Vespa velutina]|uniref:cytochrome P450 4c3-like n=1 Tax=Vespa velutina TaxID=202808 RepID=UPI001FB2D66F
TGKKWQHQRKMLTPTFHFNILKHFVVNFNEEAQYLVTLLKEEGKGGPIIKDLQEFLPVHTLNAICETAMGISLRGTGEFEAKYRHAVHDFGRIAIYKVIIAERILFHEQTKGKYLENVEEMDENQIISKETGHDTRAMMLCFALLVFAKHKDVQGRIRNEVNMVMQQNDCKLIIPLLRKLSYLERCLKESLRLYLSVHFIVRYISRYLQLKNYLIPTGSICNINIYNLHRNPNIWKNPDLFDADRFLPKNAKECNLYSFIPFSVGPRNCIDKALNQEIEIR